MGRSTPVTACVGRNRTFPIIVVAAIVVAWWHADSVNAERLKVLETDGILLCHADNVSPWREEEERNVDLAGTRHGSERFHSLCTIEWLGVDQATRRGLDWREVIPGWVDGTSTYFSVKTFTNNRPTAHPGPPDHGSRLAERGY